MRARVLACLPLLAFGTAEAAEPALMSGDWGAAACAAWNADPVLTRDLAESGWISNDKGRGYKIMQVYREDCSDKPTVELRVALRDGKVHCIYGGPVQGTALDRSADYVVHAKTNRWREMGAGAYGPMKARMLGRLSFSGPHAEAMRNIGPFTNYLRLVGKVPSNDACP